MRRARVHAVDVGGWLGEAYAMKRFVACLIGVAILSGCRDHGPPAAAYRNWGDRLVVATGLRDLGFVWPCTHRVHDKIRNYYAGIPDEECYEFGPPQRFKGLWLAEFEGSRFCPAPAKECSDDRPGDSIWLGFTKRSEVPHAVLDHPTGTGLYAVDLIGRRSSFRGWYGHLGGADYEILVDRFISVKQLAFREVPTNADYAAEPERSARHKK